MNVLLLVPSITLCVGVVGGYCLGRYQSKLMNKIRTLEGQTREVQPEPTVTMGAYEPPKDINETDQPVGLVESKTAERLQWENEIAIEKQGLS